MPAQSNPATGPPVDLTTAANAATSADNITTHTTSFLPDSLKHVTNGGGGGGGSSGGGNCNGYSSVSGVGVGSGDGDDGGDIGSGGSGVGGTTERVVTSQSEFAFPLRTTRGRYDLLLTHQSLSFPTALNFTSTDATTDATTAATTATVVDVHNGSASRGSGFVEDQPPLESTKAGCSDVARGNSHRLMDDCVVLVGAVSISDEGGCWDIPRRYE
jgi:hypothetical protein